VLRDLGSENVWVVHGEGLDEITTTGTTQVAALENGKISTFSLRPADFGLSTVTLDALKGGDGAHNAVALQAVLDGAENPYKDISLANAAASLMIAGKAKDLSEGMALARQSLSSGGARAALQRLISVSNAA
jgi:anthranilate phosphoribosyltransferase